MKKEAVYPVVLAIVSLVAGVSVGLTIAENPRFGFRPRFERSKMGYKMMAKGMLGKEEVLGMMTRKLSLSESQAEKVKGILDASRNEAKEAMKASKEKLSGIKEKKIAQIKAILSNDQQAELDKMVADPKGCFEGPKMKMMQK